ncbi:hypothetical protein [Dipodfec virus RodF1_12]|uniref:Uncharacterized protein n=1 Tax=Dipodfec virus RodF1_12 TaxID=2929289 RepID=A0A976R8Y7_9VIRU|nr:hypothetical protein [Dipodfec virus RodF1_12]
MVSHDISINIDYSPYSDGYIFKVHSTLFPEDIRVFNDRFRLQECLKQLLFKNLPLCQKSQTEIGLPF